MQVVEILKLYCRDLFYSMLQLQSIDIATLVLCVSLLALWSVSRS